eukprot:383924_1
MTMYRYLLLWCISIIVSIVSASNHSINSNCSMTYTAQIGNAALPQADNKIAVGWYNSNPQTVTLIGGALNPQQFSKFLVNSETFVDYNATYSPIDIDGSGTYYTQVDDILWIIAASGDTFVTLNLATDAIEQTSITFESTVKYGGACLTSYEEYLFVVGGDRWLHSIQIYNISSGYWLKNLPLLKVGRHGPSCAVVNNILYTIGGISSTSDLLDTAETFFFNARPGTHLSGYIMKKTLPTPLRGARAIVFGSDKILVIGGTNDIEYLSDIVVIDTVTKSIDICGLLASPAAFVAPVIVDDVLYIFGGFNPASHGDMSLDLYQKIELLQSTTTGKPITDITTSSYPTASPTEAAVVTTETVNTAFPGLTTTASPTSSPTSTVTSSPASTRSTALVTPVPVAITTSDEAGKGESDTDTAFTKKRMIIAIIVGSVILVIFLLCVCVICKRRRSKRVSVGGAYDAFFTTLRYNKIVFDREAMAYDGGSG